MTCVRVLEPVPRSRLRYVSTRNFYRWQVYGLQTEWERKTLVGVVFFHCLVNQYFLTRRYWATGHETDAELTTPWRTEDANEAD
jgi:hypothetical protein